MPDLWLSLGSNLGDREATLRAAFNDLRQRGITIQAVSSLYGAEPQGFTDQPEFLNCVARGETGLSAVGALGVCQEVEALHGRKRGIRWGPRTLDIDILFYDELASADPVLLLPHPRLWERAFVLAPLLELRPGLATPSGVAATQLLRRVTANQRVYVVSGGEWWKAPDSAGCDSRDA
jgi:2-amino-4-hydroxy-6-hydroxymethyldihydropteridine diphosphokinase